MTQIQTYVYPDGQQLSDGELIQVRVTEGSRLVFKDSYFHELQEGDVYIIPDQVELPPATDTEILDYMIDNNISWSHCGEHLLIFDRATLEDVHTCHDVTDLRSALREGITELIHNSEL